MSACSSIAYVSDDTTYSSTVSTTKSDSENRLYYRYEMSDAELKFNVYHSDNTEEQESDGDVVTKANDQLGINIFDDDTDTHSVISTKAVYDASQLSAIEKSNLNVRWTVKLRCKQQNYDEDKDLRLLSYLNSISVKGVNETTLATLTNNSSVGTVTLDGTKWYYEGARDLFEETDNVGLFDVYIDFDVKTGADLEAITNAFYCSHLARISCISDSVKRTFSV